MITVIDIPETAPAREGGVEVLRFLNAQTVGARRVEGMLYRLDAGASAGPYQEAGARQLFYVTQGRPVALYGGARHTLGPGRGVYCDLGESCGLENAAGEPAAFYRFVVPV